MFRGFIALIFAALWWVLDRLWGDPIYDQLRPMIPDWISRPSLENIVTFGPIALALAAAGYCWYRIPEQNRESEASVPSHDRSITNNASNYGSQITGDVTFNVSNGYAVLSEAEASALASKLRDLSSVEVRIIGNQNCLSIGHATVEKLKSLGVTVGDVIPIGQQIPEPSNPYEVILSDEKSSALLTIAPKAY